VGPELANRNGPKGQVSSQAPPEVLVRAVDILYGHVKGQVKGR
jgi:hypothetical protein